MYVLNVRLQAFGISIFCFCFNHSFSFSFPFLMITVNLLAMSLTFSLPQGLVVIFVLIWRVFTRQKMFKNMLNRIHLVKNPYLNLVHLGNSTVRLQRVSRKDDVGVHWLTYEVRSNFPSKCSFYDLESFLRHDSHMLVISSHERRGHIFKNWFT